MEFENSIDIGVNLGNDSMTPHFIYCGGYGYYNYYFEKLKKFILTKMKKYKIQSSIFTVLNMRRINLITKEKAKYLSKGKLKNDWEYKEYQNGSINDDLESFWNRILNSEEIKDENV